MDVANIDIDNLLSSVNIVEYISQYVDLKKRNDCYWCNSPFNKNDINPSFCIEEDKQLFYCFSTHIGGNVLTFIMCYNHISFHEAVVRLCNYIGYKNNNDIPTTLSVIKEIKKYKNNKIINTTNHVVLDKNKMQEYEEDWDKISIWEREGIDKDILKKYQVKYDVIQNRLVFPIYDINGNIINISGRTLDENYKDKKIRKYTYYYPLGALDIIYNLNQRKKDIINQNCILLFEGVKSVLLCETWGITNSAAVLTSTISNEQFKILIDLKCNIIFALDEDINILNDSKINMLKNFANVDYIQSFDNLLSSKQSPVDAGKNTFYELLEHKKHLI